MAIPEEIEEEFKFMNLKRAMLVCLCRVVGGRVGCDADDDVDMAKDMELVVAAGSLEIREKEL